MSGRSLRRRLLHWRPRHTLVLRDGFSRKQYRLVTGGRPELLRANRLRRTRRHDFGRRPGKAIIRPARITAGFSARITPGVSPAITSGIAPAITAAVTPVPASATATAAAVAITTTIPGLRICALRRIRCRARAHGRLTLFFLIRGWR